MKVRLKNRWYVILACFLFMADTSSGDTITVKGKVYEDVIIREGASLYYIQIPADGTAVTVPKADVLKENIVYMQDAEARMRLLNQWNERTIDAFLSQLPPPTQNISVPVAAKDTPTKTPSPRATIAPPTRELHLGPPLDYNPFEGVVNTAPKFGPDLDYDPFSGERKGRWVAVETNEQPDFAESKGRSTVGRIPTTEPNQPTVTESLATAPLEPMNTTFDDSFLPAVVAMMCFAIFAGFILIVNQVNPVLPVPKADTPVPPRERLTMGQKLQRVVLGTAIALVVVLVFPPVDAYERAGRYGSVVIPVWQGFRFLFAPTGVESDESTRVNIPMLLVELLVVSVVGLLVGLYFHMAGPATNSKAESVPELGAPPPRPASPS